MDSNTGLMEASQDVSARPVNLGPAPLMEMGDAGSIEPGEAWMIPQAMAATG
ncbi:hypothetical protein NQZ68_016074 [Dissostichus eleginoides]|nr:hypothetical protein NQZ68_016074 [Dissostichus eleginoides]